MKIKDKKLLTYSEYINIFLYLLERYKMTSLSKLIYTGIFLNHCTKLNCMTRKRNDVISFYFNELKLTNVLSYENISNAIDSMNILVKNNIILINNLDVVLINKKIDFIKEAKLEQASIGILIEEINSLSSESFIREVLNCV